jgi:ABC-type transport system involved in multi-copper enzyme maturation permease subunit
MRSVAIIAGGVFRDSIRDRVGYGLVFFSIMLIASSFLLAQLTAGQDVKIIKDLGLAAASAIGLFIAIFFGIGLVTKEVERRSIYSVLSKPVTRSQFVVGKYLGLGLTLVVNLAMMAAALYGVLACYDWIASEEMRASWETPALDPQMLRAFALIGVELLLITAAALFFSTFSSPFLSAALSFGVYVIGHFSEDLKHLDTIVESPALAQFARGLYYLIPNLASLDVKAEVVHGLPISGLQMLSASASTGLFITAFLIGATIVFSRRDLK